MHSQHLRPDLRCVRCPLAVAVLAMVASVAQVDAATLESARQLYLTGRYEEAIEQYQSLADESGAAVALGLARCQASLGKDVAAEDTLEAALEKFDSAAALRAELAKLYFQRGEYERAHESCEKALAEDVHQPLARWIAAELHRVRGELDEAAAGYDGLVEFYNKSESIDDAESLHVIGLATAQRARWKRDSQQFRFLVNRFYPDLLKHEKNFWPAHLEMGRLFLEKFNQRDATAQFNAALAINPNAAEIHTARAELALRSYDLTRALTSVERALEISPGFVPALQLKADALMADFQVKDAIEVLDEARKRNPRDERTLGRLATGYLYVDGSASADEADSRFGKLVAEVESHNPRCGEFYETLGDACDLLRKYPAAERYYAKSRSRMPQLVAVPAKLGMVQMRLGQEAQAKKLLEESFEADPFNVRVKNSLEVLDVLDQYAVIETEHFIIKFDRGQDQMLAEYAAEYLENEVYPQIVKQFGYEPHDKTLFEIFSRAKNTRGHGWFSARMVGLPYVGTVGACAGQMVAIASPSDMPKPYNWARVLKHEFVHVVNLQQTDFHIPHWFTEALAVRTEGYPRPPEWTQVLAKRHAAGTLFTLDDINRGFLRPGAGEDWTLAYCQAEIYAEYMVGRFGDDAPAKMLAAYHDSLSTPEAIERSFGISQEEFEAGYRDYVDKLVADLPQAKPHAAMSLADLQRAVANKPDDAQLLAALSYAYLRRESNAKARKYALAALEINEKQQLAAYVMARLYLSIGDANTAVDFLKESFQKDAPQADHLALLSAILSRAEKYDEAAQLFSLGAAKFPHDDAWLRRLASVHLRTRDDEELAEVLKRLTQLDTESVAFRTKLAQLAMDRQDYERAEHWAMEALYIHVKDARLHALRAEALAAMTRHSHAAKEYTYALQLRPDQLAWRLALAKTHIDAGNQREARLELKTILNVSPNDPGAKELLKSIEQVQP